MADATRFVIESDTLSPGLRTFPAVLQARLKVLGEYFADRAEAYAMENAPWKDRTGNARGSLSGDSRTTATQMEIVLSHGVAYGIWLEVRWGGRYAIILPTIETVGPEVMTAIRGLLA